ncbi:MAG: hypothetical protein ACLR6J_03445 [Parabacteroides merdae]
MPALLKRSRMSLQSFRADGGIQMTWRCRCRVTDIRGASFRAGTNARNCFCVVERERRMAENR